MFLSGKEPHVLMRYGRLVSPNKPIIASSRHLLRNCLPGKGRKQYGGMGTDQLKELKKVQKENEQLRRAVAELTLDKLILTEAAKGNF